MQAKVKAEAEKYLNYLLAVYIIRLSLSVMVRRPVSSDGYVVRPIRPKT